MNGVCSHERLELALAGKLDADDEATLQLHLDDCELCAAEIERLSGGEHASREIALMLNPDDLDDALPLREECSTADFVVDHLEPSDDPAVLGRLGGYDVLDMIGRGGMGVVLKGFDRELKRFVAIKALAPHLAHSALARKRFAREAQAAAAVVNLHVIAIHQVQPNGRLPFLVMPLLTGESLAQRLKARGTLELKEILRIGMQAAEGLAAAHGQGLIHRDVKPANILLEKGVERAVLTDFGLARAADDVSMTRWGIIAGTPEYMSPEQARGEALDGRSDLFSLGCVLYEMATGVSPFRTDSTMATLRRIVDEQPAAMASLVPELPPWFCHVVERLLSKDPAQRFASASEVSQLLEQCLSHLQQPTSVSLPASLLPHAADRRSIFNSTRKGVIAMLGTIGMTLLGMVLWQATEPPDISGQWTSDEWGTVVLEAKGPGEYEGTFTGSGKDKPAPSNDPPGDGPGDDSNGFGISPKSGPDASAFSDITKSSAAESKSFQSAAEAWGDFDNDGKLDRIEQPSGGPDGFGVSARSGTLHLKWSRLERRFNGTWGKGADRSGTISLRLVDKDIRGGFTTDEDVQLETGTPRVGDLLWRRSVVMVPDGGSVLLGGTKTTAEAANTPRKLNPGEILVEVYGGRGIWKSQEKQNEVGKLLLSLKAVKGVTVDIREDGEGDAVTKAVVHMPAHAGENDAESTQQDALIRTIKIAIDEALRTHRVPDVRWLDGIGKQQYFPEDKAPAQQTNSAMPARVKYFTAGHGKKIACSADGKLIAIASGGKAVPSAEGGKRTVEILDAETGITAVSISLTNEDEDALLAEIIYDFEVGALAFSPDGTLLAIGTGLGQVKLFESRTGKLVRSLDDEAARLADQKTPEKLKSLKRAMGSVSSLAFSPDGTLLATSGGSFEDAARFWGGVRELGRLATGPGRLKVWGVQSGTLRNDLVGHSHANAVAFSPDGSYLASVGRWQGGGGNDSDGSGVILWAPNTGIRLRTFEINTNGGAWSVAFSPNSKLAAISSRTFDKDNDTSTSSISLLRTGTGILEWKQTVSGWGHPVVFTRDGESVAVLCSGESIRFFDAETGTLKHRLGLTDVAQGARWNDFALLSQGKLAIAGVDNARQGNVEIWDFAGPKFKDSGIEKPLDRHNAPSETDEQSIRWGEPVNGLRLGARFEGANDQGAMQFRHGDRANIQLYLQNVGDQETDCGFDPADVCKWHNSPWSAPAEAKQQPVEVLRIKQHNGEFAEPEPLRHSDGSRVTYRIAALSSNYAKLLPQEIRRIDEQPGALDLTGREVPVKDFIGFSIVAQKRDEPSRRSHPQEYVLPSGKHTAAIAINFFNVGKQMRLECPALEFVVVDGTPRNTPGNAEQSLPPDGAKVPGTEKPLDRQNARDVVEAFVAAALAGDRETAKALAENLPSEHIADLANGLNVKRLAMKSVYVNDPMKPTKAMSTSEAVRLEGKKSKKQRQRDGFLMLTLTMSDTGWFVTDIDFESEETADRELKKFLEANPNAISVPPQASSKAAMPATGLAETTTLPDWVVAWDFRYTLLNQRYAMMRISRDGKLEAILPGRALLLRTQLSPDELSDLVALVAKNPQAQLLPLAKVAEYSQAVTPSPELFDAIKKVDVRSEIVAVVHEGELLEIDLNTQAAGVVDMHLHKLVGLAAIGGSKELSRLIEVANRELTRKFPDVSNQINQTHFYYGMVDNRSGEVSVWFRFNIDPESKDGQMVLLRISQDGQPSIEQVVLPRVEKLEPERKVPNTAVPFIELPNVQDTVPERKLPPVDGPAVYPKLADKRYVQSGAPLAEQTWPMPPWGEEKDGLSAGIRVIGDARIGGEVKAELWVRNSSKKDVKFSRCHRADVGLWVIAKDKDGKEHDADITSFRGRPVFSHLLLPAGHVVKVKEFTVKFGSRKNDELERGWVSLDLPPGDFKLSAKWSDTTSGVAHEGEWTGKLTTGEVDLKIVAADEGANAEKPAANPPGGNMVKVPDDQYVKAGFPLADLAGEGVAWSDAQNGLSLGRRITGDEWRILGKEVKVELWVQNPGDKDVKFQLSMRPDIGLTMKMKDEKGRVYDSNIVPIDVPPFGELYLLPPGHALKVKEFTVSLMAPANDASGIKGRYFAIDAGAYKFHCELDLPGFSATGRDGTQLTPAAGEWTGKLTTGEIDVMVVAPDAPAATEK